MLELLIAGDKELGVNMRNSKNSKLDIVIPVITLVSILGVLFAIGLFIRDSYLETISVQTDAKVLSIDYNSSQKFATVTYKVEDVDYVISAPLNDEDEVAVNELITIKYNVNNPGVAIYNEHLTEILIIVFISLFGVAITTNSTIRIIKDYKYLKQLKQNGIKLESTIIDIYIDVTIPRRKEDLAYRIRSKYLNPQDNKEYIFDSAYTYENLKVKYPTFENATITVYLDQTNTNIYYVDLNSVKLNESIKVEDENSTIKSIKSEESHEEESK
jgi:hypothetical protein